MRKSDTNYLFVDVNSGLMDGYYSGPRSQEWLEFMCEELNGRYPRSRFIATSCIGDTPPLRRFVYHNDIGAPGAVWEGVLIRLKRSRQEDFYQWRITEQQLLELCVLIGYATAQLVAPRCTEERLRTIGDPDWLSRWIAHIRNQLHAKTLSLANDLLTDFRKTFQSEESSDGSLEIHPTRGVRIVLPDTDSHVEAVDKDEQVD